MRKGERFKELFDLKGRVAVVTGAAKGNGAGIANALYDAGAQVMATDVAFSDEGDSGSQSLYPEIPRMVMDVTSEESVGEVFATIVKEQGRLDILCNNAGVIYKAPVDELEMEQFRKVTEINLHGVVNCTKHAVPYMRKNSWGRIVNISSSQAFLATETYSAYSASKAAVSHLTRIWGNELAAENILVNALCPCFVKTPMMTQSIAKKAQELGGSLEMGEKYFTDLIPTHRLLEIEEIGNWVTLLCGEMGRAMTGSNISITCGQVTL
ncbi:SDR family NAD(P)-dependent oxidoreductase [Ohessyouella blattaphilus]|uniref:SDR family oxidoreductase n=1 Tax=Ohessyouella blattaphilus TaxID=2949333 RepID=A0ABT1EK70_9FIRM|nr:SDR family oxidoreductase [Ohessyouella blattaphilus]MCP1110157.1 SDR family oxidoreductase [Ohessyouella blattaphilus]MCR8563551.1 SDR family oxidoreductase [Ohessyouella blattaphilus]